VTEQKRRAYKYLIFVSILSIIVSGITYLAFKVPVVGIACVITMISSTIAIVGYNIEK
jgi:uncharacterized membrane protein